MLLEYRYEEKTERYRYIERTSLQTPLEGAGNKTLPCTISCILFKFSNKIKSKSVD